MTTSHSPDTDRETPPPAESGVRVVGVAKRFEARTGWYAVARCDSLPALLRWARVHSGPGTEIVRIEDDVLMATIESMSVIGLIPVNAMLRWVGMRTRILKSRSRRLRLAS